MRIARSWVCSSEASSGTRFAGVAATSWRKEDRGCGDQQDELSRSLAVG